MPTVKKNPNKKLREQLPTEPLKAYKKGYADGYEDALSATMNLVIWTLADNALLTDGEIKSFCERFQKTLDMINTDHITMKDILKTLKSEYDWEIKFKTGGN